MILAEFRDLAQDHAIGLVYLLENLGFVISQPKSSFSVSSVQQELSLPAGKTKKDQGRNMTLSGPWSPGRKCGT